MSTKLDARINEGSTIGFKVRLYDTNSSVVIPDSLDWYLYDSLGNGVSSGPAISLSSESLITIGSSLTLTVSGEVRPEPKRQLHTIATYTDSELGAGAVERETFIFTICNNPWIP